MEIDINQKKISISDKSNIFIDGQQTHVASKELLTWLPEIHLYESGHDTPRYTIKKKWTLFKPSYNLTRWDNNIFEFRTKHFWKSHYCCQVEQDLYDIFGHKGRKYSVYKNDRQVAWWDKRAVSWFEGDNYKIIADKDCDYELLISFCLVIDNAFSSDKDGNTITIDFGHIGPQARKFEPTWQPKY